MTHIEKYYFEWGNGLVQFNSLSPNHKYFYKIKKPDDLYWGLFVAKIAFYSISGKLIYFNNISADPLHDNKTNKIKYASYSLDGNYAYFRERESINTIQNIILNLTNGTYKRMSFTNIEDVKKLEIDGFHVDCLSIFNEVDWQKANIRFKFNRNIFGKKVWFPG